MATHEDTESIVDMTWFKRKKAGILTSVREQNESPDGLWQKCPSCGEVLNKRELLDHLMVCTKCGHHLRMNSAQYFQAIFDEGRFVPYDEDLQPVDRLGFVDRKSYAERLEATQRQSGLNDAVRSAVGTVGGHTLSLAAMDFGFIGGSMGSVVGEVITRSVRRGVENRCPVMVISQSGGARMMEGALSLMQMAKTSANLAVLAEEGLPYISLMTDPTTGGVTASYAMLGDFNLAEPGALIGFAGPRVIRETIGQDLPAGFQRAEFLQEKGFIDFIVPRKELRERLITLLDLLNEN